MRNLTLKHARLRLTMVALVPTCFSYDFFAIRHRITASITDHTSLNTRVTIPGSLAGKEGKLRPNGRMKQSTDTLSVSIYSVSIVSKWFINLQTVVYLLFRAS